MDYVCCDFHLWPQCFPFTQKGMIWPDALHASNRERSIWFKMHKVFCRLKTEYCDIYWSKPCFFRSLSMDRLSSRIWKTRQRSFLTLKHSCSLVAINVDVKDLLSCTQTSLRQCKQKARCSLMSPSYEGDDAQSHVQLNVSCSTIIKVTWLNCSFWRILPSCVTIE